MSDRFYINEEGTKVHVPNTWRNIFHDSLTTQGFTLLEFVNKNKDGDPRKILIERNTGGLGDILMIKPAVEQIAASDLDVTVSFPGQYAWMFRHSKVRFIDCYVFCQNYIENRKPFGLVFNLQCPYIDYKSRMGWRPKKNRIEIFAKTMSVEPRVPELVVNQRFTEKRFKNGIDSKIGLIMEVADRTRPWPLERWVELARKLKKIGLRPVTISRTKSVDDIEYVAGISMEKLVSIISQMDIIVAADTGPLHIGAVLNKKVIGLFGPTNGKLICKMYPTVQVIQKLKGPTPCFRPCYGNAGDNDYCCGELRYSTCMWEIASDEVVNAIIQKS